MKKELEKLIKQVVEIVEENEHKYDLLMLTYEVIKKNNNSSDHNIIHEAIYEARDRKIIDHSIGKKRRKIKNADSQRLTYFRIKNKPQ